MVDWRALVEYQSPQMTNIREFCPKKNIKKFRFSKIIVFFWYFFVFFFIFLYFLRFYISPFFQINFFLSRFLDFISKLLWLLLKVIEFTTEHQKWPKISKKSIACCTF